MHVQANNLNECPIGDWREHEWIQTLSQAFHWIQDHLHGAVCTTCQVWAFDSESELSPPHPPCLSLCTFPVIFWYKPIKKKRTSDKKVKL